MEYEVEEVSLNPALNASLFNVPETVRANAPKMATANIPYLWILRRQLIGSYYDVDNLTHDPSRVKLALVERAPGVVQVQGTIHHTLIVEMDQFLVVFDAPYMDGYSRWVIDAAKQRFPNKPIKYLVLTHHHIDHVAGYRTFLAEGASLVVGRGTKDFWRKVLASSDTLGIDTPKKRLADAEVIEVAASHSITDGKRRVELHELRSNHSDGMLIGLHSRREARVPDGHLDRAWRRSARRAGDAAAASAGGAGREAQARRHPLHRRARPHRPLCGLAQDRRRLGAGDGEHLSRSTTPRRPWTST